jgi:recombination protein RecA
MAKKKEVVSSDTSPMASLLAEYGLGNVLRLAEDLPGMEVEVFSSGFISVDNLINKRNSGVPRGRDIEIYSRDGSAGKTSLALKIIAAAQRQGLKCAVADVEHTLTTPYLVEQGIYLYEKDCPEGVFPLYILSARYDEKTGTYENLSLEDVFKFVSVGSQKVFDLIVVDSVDAMVEESQIEKTADENHKQGGIAKKMGEFLRKNTAKKATIIWLNQTRQAMSSGPSYSGPMYIPSGGRALAFYSSVRLQLDMIKKLEEANKDPYGFTTKVTIVKNKLGPKWRSTELNYIFDVGFSNSYDYMKLALTDGTIVKNGAWFNSPLLDIKIQGEYNLFKRIDANENSELDVLKAKYNPSNVVTIAEETPNLEIEKEQNTYAQE